MPENKEEFLFSGILLNPITGKIHQFINTF